VKRPRFCGEITVRARRFTVFSGCGAGVFTVKRAAMRAAMRTVALVQAHERVLMKAGGDKPDAVPAAIARMPVSLSRRAGCGLEQRSPVGAGAMEQS
jgi:hypothetical protein